MMPMDGIAKMILPAVMHGPWVRGGSGIVRVMVACSGTALDTKTIVKVILITNHNTIKDCDTQNLS